MPPRSVALCCSLVVGCAALVAAAELDPDAVAARVGDEPISIRQCEREVRRVAPALPSDPAALESLRHSALLACIDRAAALGELTAQGRAASDADVELAVSRMKKELAARDIPWERHLERQGLNDREYRQEIRWGLSWDAALKRDLTDANLQRVFEARKREFDGTRVRVAHLLLKIPGAADPDALATVQAEAAKVRAQIVAGALSFADAAKQFSQAPTAPQGGDIGFIERRGPMAESFTAAAFALEIGAVSEPVVSPAGVHLITCLAIEPGERPFAEARDEVAAAATKILFHHLARRRKEAVPVHFTGRYAGVDPQTNSPAPRSP